jgi:primosomal protein N' (replication factor Y)
VLVQTLVPESRCLQHAAAHDAEAFLEEEIARRRALRYPPFSRLVRVVTAAAAEPLAARAAARIRAGLEGGSKAADLELLGPAPLFRLKDRHRYMLLLKSAPDALDVGAVGESVQEVAADRGMRGVSFAVDVDPQ